MMKGRRRQHLFAVCVLMVIAGGFLESRVSRRPADRPLSGRRLLHNTTTVASCSPFMIV